MKVTCVQMDMKFASPDENFQKAESLIRKAAAERWVAACRSFGVIARRETTSRDEFDRYCERLLEGK